MKVDLFRKKYRMCSLTFAESSRARCRLPQRMTKKYALLMVVRECNLLKGNVHLRQSQV